MFCCDSHRGAKFPIEVSARYIPMKDSALVAPYITTDELEQHSRLMLLEEKHSSKAWIKILDEFHELHGTRSQAWENSKLSETIEETTHYNFDDDEADVSSVARSPSGIPSEVVSSSVKPVEMKSIMRGAGAFRMLSGSGLEAIKAILPVSNLFVKIDEDDDSDAPALKSSTPTVADSVETLLRVVPEGLKELETKLKESVRLLEEDGDRRSKAYLELLTDLFGGRDRQSFLAEFHSFARGITRADTNAESALLASEEAQNLSNELSEKCTALEKRAITLSELVHAGASKTESVVAALVTRFNNEISILSGRLSRAETDGRAPSSTPPVPPSLQNTSLPYLDPNDSSNAPFLAGYHHCKSNEFAVGTNVRERTRFNYNGWNVVALFDSEEEMKEWLRSKNPWELSVPLAAQAPAQAPVQAPDAEIQALNARIDALTQQLQDIERLASKGKGVDAGGESFDSEDEIVALMVAEGLDPKKLLGGAVDFVSLFAHEKDGRIDDNKLSLEMKQMKMAGIDNAAALNYVGSFRQQQPRYFLNSSNHLVKHGDRFPMLENAVAWEGSALVKGANIELEKTISDTSKQVDLYIKQNIPLGRIHNLCRQLNLDTTRWTSKIIAYINRELKEVANYGIPAEKVYTLLSNQLNIIFLAIWEVRMMMQEFSTDRDETLYVARTIYITMQAHMVMEEFAALDFKSHNLISSIFIRFLAEETGSNFASGLEAQLKEILSDIAKLKSELNSKTNGFNRRFDNHTENLKAVCTKVDVRYKPLSNSNRE